MENKKEIGYRYSRYFLAKNHRDEIQFEGMWRNHNRKYRKKKLRKILEWIHLAFTVRDMSLFVRVDFCCEADDVSYRQKKHKIHLK
jgi:hypothetical protein